MLLHFLESKVKNLEGLHTMLDVTNLDLLLLW